MNFEDALIAMEYLGKEDANPVIFAA